MSNHRDPSAPLWGPGSESAPQPAPERAGSVHSLHLWREQPDSPPPHHQAQPPIKPDRLLVGVIAGAALLYFIGRALGLGRRRGTHVEP